MINSPKDGQSTSHDHGFFVDHIVLVADKVGREGGTGGKDGCLRDQGGSGQSINYGLGSFRWRFRGDIGSVAVRG